MMHKKVKRQSYRRSVEQKLDSLTDTLTAVQQVLALQATAGGNTVNEQSNVVNPPNVGKNEVIIAGESETTIYKNAVEWQNASEIEKGFLSLHKDYEQSVNNKRGSTSSEDQIDMSDELIEENLVSGVGVANVPGSDTRLSTSGGRPQPALAMEVAEQDGLSVAQRMIKEAETTHSRMTATKGECELQPNLTGFLHSAFVDEEYMVIGSHIEDSICKKIINHEYVDFAKLLPRDRVGIEDDQRMELINQNGFSFWTPVVNSEIGQISSFSKWELAFRVFANIYTTKYPNKAAELIQYSHVIHMASQTYSWDNMYYYDREFHIHMSRHPQHSWAVILQQAWNLHLKDKIKYETFGEKGRSKSKEVCKRFNKGKCHSGSACRYEHQCLNCGKFGHGEHICCKKLENLKIQDENPTKNHDPSGELGHVSAGTSKQ